MKYIVSTGLDLEEHIKMKSGKASIHWMWVVNRLLIPELPLAGIVDHSVFGPAVPALASSVPPLLSPGSSLLQGSVAILLERHQLLLLCLLLGLFLGLFLFFLLPFNGLFFLAGESWEVTFRSDHDASGMPDVPNAHAKEHRHSFKEVEEDFLCREDSELVVLRAFGEFGQTVGDSSLPS